MSQSLESVRHPSQEVLREKILEKVFSITETQDSVGHPTLNSQYMLLISIFQLQNLTFAVLSEKFYFCGLFSSFSHYKLPLQSLVFSLSGGISGCASTVQRCQLHFSRLFLVHRTSFQDHSSQQASRQAGRPAFLCHYFSADYFFCPVIFHF